MPGLFRETALKKLRDPEQLDSAIKLASPRGWLALAAVGLVIASVVFWGFVGKLSFQVEGIGVVLREGGVVFDVNSPGSGTVSRILIKVGDKVRTGQEVVRLSLPELDRQIEEARRSYTDLKSRYDRESEFVERDVSRREQNVQSQVHALEEKIGTATQRQEFFESLSKIEEQDLKKGYITRQQYESTLTSLYSATQEVRDYRNQVSSLLTDQVEYENELVRALADLELQVLDARGQFEVLETTLQTEAFIPSPTDGTVTEVSVQLGDVVIDNQIVSVVEQAGGDLQLYGYFPVGQAKRVSKGMLAQVSPTSVESDIFGTIRGSVIDVGSLVETSEGINAIVGNEQLVDQIMAAGPPIQILIALDKDSSTVSGLEWSSSVGPPIQITAGTMAGVRITVRDERPVDLVVPIYETWVGIN